MKSNALQALPPKTTKTRKNSDSVVTTKIMYEMIAMTIAS